MENSNLGTLCIGSHLMLEEASLILTRQGIKLVFRQAWPMVESRRISTQRGWGTVMNGGGRSRGDVLWDPLEAWGERGRMQLAFCCSTRDEPEGLV